MGFDVNEKDDGPVYTGGLRSFGRCPFAGTCEGLLLRTPRILFSVSSCAEGLRRPGPGAVREQLRMTSTGREGSGCFGFRKSRGGDFAALEDEILEEGELNGIMEATRFEDWKVSGQARSARLAEEAKACVEASRKVADNISKQE